MKRLGLVDKGYVCGDGEREGDGGQQARVGDCGVGEDVDHVVGSKRACT